MMYAAGTGILQDSVEAVRWFRKAAEQGNAKAQYQLGLMYASGKGISQDDIQAYVWLNHAVAQGIEKAKRAIDILVGRMTRKQISQAQTAAMN